MSKGVKEYSSHNYGVEESRVIQEEPYANSKAIALQKKAPGSQSLNRKASVEISLSN